MARHILAIDQGTTGTTSLIVDVTDPKAPTVVGRQTVDFPQHYPKTGWVEHDLHEVWTSVVQSIKGAVAAAATRQPGFKASSLAAVGISNQRETLCVMDRATGMPLTRAIVWQCKRSADICRRLRSQGFEDVVRSKTGLVLDPYFSGTKATWLMENDPETASKLKSGQAVLGTIDTYLAMRLSGGAAFVTEASNASRTLCYDIRAGRWDRDLAEMLKIPSLDVLPRVMDSAGLFGTVKGVDGLPDGLPITGILGDQQAALAGQACFEPGEAKCTFGTGAFLLLNLGHEKLASRAGLLTTVAWSLGGKLSYAFEGSAFIAGAAVQFLRDQWGLVKTASESQAAAEKALASPEVYFVPALAGLGAPYWDPKAQGAFFGLTRGTTRGQTVRAALEGIAFQVSDLIGAMRQDVRAPFKVLRVDGGAAANDLLMQVQANFADVDVDRPLNLETTAFGAAMFAGLGVGIYPDLNALKHARKRERVFNPETSSQAARDHIAAQLAGWHRAIKAVQIFAGTV